jgi:hypothetical protein
MSKNTDKFCKNCDNHKRIEELASDGGILDWCEAEETVQDCKTQRSPLGNCKLEGKLFKPKEEKE